MLPAVQKSIHAFHREVSSQHGVKPPGQDSLSKANQLESSRSSDGNSYAELLPGFHLSLLPRRLTDGQGAISGSGPKSQKDIPDFSKIPWDLSWPVLSNVLPMSFHLAAKHIV